MAKVNYPPTTDALEILQRRYVEGNPEMLALVEQERVNATIARAIYDLRTRLGLTQRELARMVNTTASVICRLEDADYQGHSTAMLQRIAVATGQRLEMEVHFIPKQIEHVQPGKKSPAKAKKAKKLEPA